MSHHRALLICLLLCAFTLRAAALDFQSMWRDEIDTLCFALDFWETFERALLGAGDTGTMRDRAQLAGRAVCHATPGLSSIDPSRGAASTLWGLLTLRGWNGPLYTLAMHPWIALVGYSPFAVRFSSTLLGLLAVPLGYVLGRRLFGVGVGLVTATLIALSPHLVWYSQEAKMYALLLALGLLTLYAFRRAVDAAPSSSGVTWWGVTVAATTLAFYSHVLLALLIPLLFVLGLIWWPRTRHHWRRALLALAFLTLPYVPLLAWQARNWFLLPGQATLFAVDRLDVMLQATFDGWGGNFVGEPWATLVLGSLSLLALFGLFRSWLTPAVGDGSALDRKEPGGGGGRELLGLLTWMLLPLLGIWLISARQPIFTNRYLVWAAPAFYALAAVGCVALLRFGRGGAFLAIGLLLVVLVGDGRSVWYQDRHPIKPDFRSAATHLEAHYRSSDLIVFHLSYMEDNFDYYFDSLYSGWGAPAAGGEMSDADLDLYMRNGINGHETVWLVLSESQMWDPQGRVKAWMDAQAVAPPEERAFAHVSVYRYRLSAPASSSTVMEDNRGEISTPSNRPARRTGGAGAGGAVAPFPSPGPGPGDARPGHGRL